MHGNSVAQHGGPWVSGEQRLTLPDTFYGAGDYNVIDGLTREADSDDQMSVGFGQSLDANVSEVKAIEVAGHQRVRESLSLLIEMISEGIRF